MRNQRRMLADRERRRNEVKSLLLEGIPRPEIVERLTERYSVSEASIRNDIAAYGREVKAEGAHYAQLARETCTTGLLEVFRAAMGKDLADVPPELLGLDTDDPSHAVEVAKLMYPQLRKRDLTAAVAAMRELGKLHGAYEPEQVTVDVQGGVLVAPARMSIDEWKASVIDVPPEPAQLPAPDDEPDW